MSRSYCAKMFGPVVLCLTVLLGGLSCCRADANVNITDANLTPMALASSPVIVDSGVICPDDSEAIDGICTCRQDLCEPPPCDEFLNLIQSGTAIPGNCCNRYSCDNCTGETLINGTCGCIEDAFLNRKGVCECHDHHKSLKNGTCVCDSNKCELPLLCDIQSVPIRVKEGCCEKTICKPCPEDSYATDHKSDEIESKCVCYPCYKTECNETHVPDILRRGQNVPEQCCDIYKCIPKNNHRLSQECVANDVNFTHGQWWITNNKQNCSCIDGFSICNDPETTDIFVRSCIYNNTAYPVLASWTEDSCTNCTCFDDGKKCVSHMCNVTMSEVKKYKDCLAGEHSYPHLTSWMIDSCNNCTCYNGSLNCSTITCNLTEVKKNDDCPSIENCKKYCKNGYKVNKRGCKICKCKLPEYITEKYLLLDAYMRDHNLTETETIKWLQNFSRKEEQATPPTITANPNKDIELIVILPPIITFCTGILFCFSLMKCWKKKCTYQYSPVLKPLDNNNLPLQADIKYITEKSPLKT